MAGWLGGLGVLVVLVRDHCMHACARMVCLLARLYEGCFHALMLQNVAKPKASRQHFFEARKLCGGGLVVGFDGLPCPPGLGNFS